MIVCTVVMQVPLRFLRIVLIACLNQLPNNLFYIYQQRFVQFKKQLVPTLFFWLKACILQTTFHEIFDLLFSLDHAKKIKQYLTFRHPNKNVSLVKEYMIVFQLQILILLVKKEACLPKKKKKEPSLAYMRISIASFIPENYKTVLQCLNWCLHF